MAEKELTKIRVQSLCDTYNNWTTANPVLKKGEIAVVEVPAETGAATTEPTYLLKIGDGVKHFNALGWASGLAADVYPWAKTATKPTYNMSELINDVGASNSIVSFDSDGNLQASSINVLSENESYFYSTNNAGFCISSSNPNTTSPAVLQLTPGSDDDPTAGILIGAENNNPITPNGIGIIFDESAPESEASTIYIGFNGNNSDNHIPYVKWNNANKTFTYAVGDALDTDIDTIIPFEGGNNSLTPKHYVDAQKVNSYTIIIPSTGWKLGSKGYEYTYSNTSFRASISPIITCTSNINEYQYITEAEATTGVGITFRIVSKTLEKPLSSITLQIIELG